jgi:tripartite-type tricarboxylate transporter receptor subunit TctC
MFMRYRCSCAVLVTCFMVNCLLLAADVQAAPYYQGKVISIVVGSTPGGGYDRMARLLAKHLKNYIPGKPTIVVQNVIGAGGIIAANQVFNISKPDGLTIGTFNRGLLFTQLLQAEGVKYDLMKFSWLGSPSVETATLALRPDLPFKTVGDILGAKQTIMLGSAGGVSDSGTIFTTLLNKFLKLNMKIIHYQASSEVMLAVERKEVDGIGGSFSTLQPYANRNLLRFWIRGRFSTPEIENLPVDENLTTDKVGKTIMAIRSAGDGIGRPYVAPPGVPDHIMKTLREAFAKVTNDPELRNEAKRLGMEIGFVAPEECMKSVKFVLTQPNDMVKEAGKYIKF